MKHTFLSRFAIVGAFLAALACVALAPSEAHAQRYRGGRQSVVVVPRGGYNNGYRRQVVVRPNAWARPRYQAPRYQPAPRFHAPRYNRRGRW